VKWTFCRAECSATPLRLEFDILARNGPSARRYQLMYRSVRKCEFIFSILLRCMFCLVYTGELRTNRCFHDAWGVANKPSRGRGVANKAAPPSAHAGGVRRRADFRASSTVREPRGFLPRLSAHSIGFFYVFHFFPWLSIKSRTWCFFCRSTVCEQNNS